MHYSLIGFSVLGISQAITLEWIVISFSNGSCDPRDWTQVSCLAGGSVTTWEDQWATWEEGIHNTPNKITKCIVLFFCEGWSHEIQCASVLWSHRGPASTVSPKCLVDILPNGLFSPKHHPFLSNWSLHWPFFPVITPTSPSLLSHKAELPVDHELNWPSSERLLCP